MSNKNLSSLTLAERPTAMTLRGAVLTSLPVLLMTAMLLTPSAHAQTETAETIDAFAREHLQSMRKGDAPRAIPVELVFIQGKDKRRTAYLLVDGQYGKSVKANDVVKGWTVRAIAADSVDLEKGGRRERLLLATELTPHRPSAKP